MLFSLYLPENLDDEEDEDDGIIDYDSRDPNIPYPIQADKDNWYAEGCVGEKYDKYLLSICGNSRFWEKRYKVMQSHMEGNTGLIKSTRFRKIMTHERSSSMMLRAVCNVSYLMPCQGKYAWELPKNVPENEFNEYWDDAWRWCSISGNTLDKPDDWAVIKQEEDSEETTEEDK